MSEWSHAGGVVVRTVNGEREYLLVEAKRSPGVWVLPKGHIEEGESPEAAAGREVEEEAAVRAAIVAPAGEIAFTLNGKLVRTIVFLMRYERDVPRTEDRACVWRRYDAALRLLHFENTRQVLMKANAIDW